MIKLKIAAVAALAFGAGYTVPVVAAVAAPTTIVADVPAAATTVVADAPAPAQALTPPAGDPVDDPAAWYDAVRTAWEAHHVLALLVVLLAGLRVASTRLAWLRTGKRVAYVGAASTLLLTLIETWPASLAGWIGWLFPAVLAVALMLFEALRAPPAAT